MSIMHYIAAGSALPMGESGGKKLREVNRSEKKVKAIRFISEKLPEGAVPLEQIIDLSDIKEDETEVYATFEDAAGIYVEDITPQEDAVRKHFRNQFVYRVSPCWGNFFINEQIKNMHPDRYKASRKCLTELFEYIRRNSAAGEEVEIYTCWYDEGEKARNDDLDTFIDLKAFVIEDDFGLREGQYIVVKT